MILLDDEGWETEIKATITIDVDTTINEMWLCLTKDSSTDNYKFASLEELDRLIVDLLSARNRFYPWPPLATT